MIEIENVTKAYGNFGPSTKLLSGSFGTAQISEVCTR